MRTKEQKEVILKQVIENVKNGMPSTGKNSACNIEGENLTFACVYNWFFDFPELKAEYKQAREACKTVRQGSESRLAISTKRELLRKIIAYIAEGYTIRGKHNAILRASKELNIPPVHWQTVHVWLRRDFKELQPSYHAAKEARKAYTVRKNKAVE
jgi:hypothetical protein